MVSFWPFKGDSNDAASFEKVLSQLSTKINKSTAQNERFQASRRRYKALWTLYTIFAYILVAAILTLVTGWEKWGAVEFSLLAGGPLLIYGVRTGLDAYYNWRLANSQNYLNDLHKQREVAIEKLKAATKYNSTQQLLEKYGGSPPRKDPQAPQPKGKRQSHGGQGIKPDTLQPGRTGFAPPPTANIPGRQPPPPVLNPTEGAPGSAPAQKPAGLGGPSGPPLPSSPNSPGEEFAPNAFIRPPTLRQPSQYATEGPKWYDRILDVVLGDDETSSKNRIALICQNCRLVNGQAPPGARTLEDVGKWRCSQCRAWNGVESEENKILKHISQSGGEPISPQSPEAAPLGAATDAGAATLPEEDEHDGDGEGGELDGGGEEAVDTPPAASTRSKARQRKS